MKIQRQKESFAFRVAASDESRSLALEYTDKLYKEFHDWIDEQGKWPVGPTQPTDYTKPMGGPLTYWDNIEEFVKERYPAAHRAYRYGEENAAQALDGGAMRMPTQYSPWPNRTRHPGYETGPEAIEKYGYDPRQVAAGFMYLHTNAHMTARPTDRVPHLERDIDRLADIFDTRQKMHEHYLNNNPARRESPAAEITAAATHLAAGSQPGYEHFNDEDWQHAINALLSYRRFPEAIALWEHSGLPLDQMSRQRELQYHSDSYSSSPRIMDRARNRVRENPEQYSARAVYDHADRQADPELWTMNQIRRMLSQGRYNDAIAEWSMSRIPLEEFDEQTANSIRHRVGLWGFPDEPEWGINDNYAWARDDYEDYSIRQYHLNGEDVPMRIRHNDERLNHPEWYRDDVDNDGYVNTEEKVENNTDPNAKLKSPWSRKIQHYPGAIPHEFYTRGLYDDYNLGGPSVPHDLWERDPDPDVGVYQINDSRRALHKPPAGYVQYYKDDDSKKVKIQLLETHPKYRGQGVATALVNALAEDFPDYKIDPGSTTSHGTGFVDYMRRNAPNAQERLDTSEWSPDIPNRLTDDQLQSWGVEKRRSPVFARIAEHNRMVEHRWIESACRTVSLVTAAAENDPEWEHEWRNRPFRPGTSPEMQKILQEERNKAQVPSRAEWEETQRYLNRDQAREDLLKKLEREFMGWYEKNGNERLNWANRGPLGNWHQIENFLKVQYPEAHKGITCGLEQAGKVLDTGFIGEGKDYCPRCENHPFDKKNCQVCGGTGMPSKPLAYETGLEAVQKYGYDPKEVAAGMLLLHNRTHPHRNDLERADTDRLADIARIRSQQQRAYDEQQQQQAQNVTAAMHFRVASLADHMVDIDEEGLPRWLEGDDRKIGNAYLKMGDEKNLAEHLAQIAYLNWQEAEGAKDYDNAELWHSRSGQADNYVSSLHNKTAAMHFAAPVDQNIVQKLKEQFDNWTDTTDQKVHKDTERGPIGVWTNIENFLGQHYPAAHRDLMMGQEMARPLLDGQKDGDSFEDPRDFSMLNITYGDSKQPYETGPQAQAQYGYDPREVAAAMLLLHNKSHRLRRYRDSQDQARLDEIEKRRNEEFDNADVDLLHGIAQTRTKMNQDYQNTLVQAARILRTAMPWRIEHPDYEPADVAPNYNPDMGATQGGGDSRNYLVGPRDNIWWHGSANGDIGSNGESRIGFHIGDYQTAADALSGRVGKNPNHPLGRWDGKTSLAEAFPDSFDENGDPIPDPRRHYPIRFRHPDGTPMHGSYRPNVFPVAITGPMGNTTDSAVSDGQAHALMKRQHTRPPRTPKGYYYINAGEGQGVGDQQTGIVNPVSATIPSAAHIQKLDPATYDHIAEQAHKNWNEDKKRVHDFNPYRGLSMEERQIKRRQDEQERGRRVQEWRKRRRNNV